MARRIDQDVIVELFMEYLEGKMVGTVIPDILCGPECFRGSEVGEGGAPDHTLLYRGGAVTICPAGPAELASRGLEMYPRDHLSTEHALLDRWTAQISRLHLVESNLTIMVDALTNTLGREERTVGRLEALKSDLPTLTQFLQFSSAMQPTRVPSVGPVLIRDVWIPSHEVEEDVIAIRLRGGNKLDAPPLRDATWVWLTLLEGETLRERYIELCDDYCNAFNKVLLRREASSIVEELSYFDVMRDLGENFLHAFLTIIHKFVVSGTWFFDRGLHTDEGIQSLVDVISFLVDNGIVGSIFVI
ncbi:hypothetical protein Pmani_035597 [Petrolisthes manimaculis]|uniref:Uncharacterized protein n=1 Tax=Petrolisthes manimaculis TaxID=1843537 RepID=A0AAE1NMM3_9EUCA|nr:hypothetical protein Pmani_035597 [Petrolisthes manimaculis]